MSKSGTKTGLFLIELVVALLLFAFCAAICMQLFVAARGRTSDSDNLSQSVYLATSAAECYKNSGGDIEAVRELLGGETSNGDLLIMYNKDWSRVSALDAFFLTIWTDGAGAAEITVFETGRGDNGEYVAQLDTAKVIYTITVKAVSYVA